MIRRIVLALSLLLFPALAAAGPNSGGTLILHANTQLVYTDDNEGYCGQSGLTSCEDAVVRAPADPDSIVIFFAVAAFPPNGSPRLKALTFGIEYDAERLVLVDRGSCGGFELADGGWPDPGTGTALVLDEVSTTTLTPVYWFAAYAYSFGDMTSLVLVPHPVEGGAFGDDSVPTQLDDIAGYGAIGFGEPG